MQKGDLTFKKAKNVWGKTAFFRENRSVCMDFVKGLERTLWEEEKAEWPLYELEQKMINYCKSWCTSEQAVTAVLSFVDTVNRIQNNTGKANILERLEIYAVHAYSQKQAMEETE